MKHLFKILSFVFKHKKELSLAYLGLILSTVFALAIPKVIGFSLDSALENTTLAKLFLIGGLLLLTSLSHAASTFIQTFYTQNLSQKVSFDIRNVFLRKLEHLNFKFFDSENTGNLLTKGTFDIEVTQMFVQVGMFRTPYIIMLLIAIPTILLISNLTLGLIAITGVPIAMIVSLTVSKKARKMWTWVQHNSGKLTTILQETLSGIKLVKVFGAEEFKKQQFERLSSQLGHKHWATRKLIASRTSFLQFIFSSIGIIILWIGGYQVFNNSISPGQLTEFVFYLNMLIQPIRMLGFMLGHVTRAIPSSERIFSVIESKEIIENPKEPIKVKKLLGHIQFKNVSFSYLPKRPVLQNISLDIKPGEKIAILGAPGSGKSTLNILIPRFYDVTAGSIEIDGHDIRQLPIPILHDQIGTVFQDVFLFSDTIKENIKYGKPKASFEEIVKAAQIAQIHSFIEALPEKYNTMVGENGVALSGGQRQRVNIARTILRNPSILLLDDPTSALDTETETNLEKELEIFAKNRTTIMIAHRIKTLKTADLIIVLDDGQIIQQGTHKQLIQEDGLYKIIYELQFNPKNVDQVFDDLKQKRLI